MAPPKTSQLLGTLVETASAIVEESGSRGVTLRSVSERVTADGRPISHTAAFAHVSGKPELLAHVAAGGWERLLDNLEKTRTIMGPADRLVELGSAYRGFAAKHPNLFRVMYDAEMWVQITAMPTQAQDLPSQSVSRFKHPEVLDRVRERRDDAFGLFVHAVSEGIRTGAIRGDAPPLLAARSLASLAHGLAMEALDERLPEDEVRPILHLAIAGLRAG